MFNNSFKLLIIIGILFSACFLSKNSLACKIDAKDPEFKKTFEMAWDCQMADDGFMKPFPEKCKKQTCDSVVVNQTSDCTFTSCRQGYCNLTEAWNLAKTCAAPVTITFKVTADSKPSATSIDTQSFTLSDNAHPVTIDGGSSHFIFDGKTSSTNAFTVKGPHITLKNLLIKDYKGPAVKVDASAINFNLLNTTINSSLATAATSDALESSGPNASNTNVPIFIRPGPLASQYVVYAILPKESEIHFYQKSSNPHIEWVGIEYNLLPNPQTGALEYSPLLDLNGNVIDGDSMQVVAGLLPGFVPGDKFIALVKNKNKNIALVQGTSDFFKDSDQDFLSDESESKWFGTDPNKIDSDGNGVADYSQVIDPANQVPRAKKNPEGTYAYVPGNFNPLSNQGNPSPTPTGPTLNSNPANDGGGGACSLAFDAAYNGGIFIPWILTGFAFAFIRLKKMK